MIKYMELNRIDWKLLYFIPEKKGGYRISYNMSKFKFETPEFINYFGIEDYNKKEILNIEMDDITNEKHNFICEMENIETLIKNYSDRDKLKSNPFIKLPPDFLKDLGNKVFTPTIKKSINNKNLRTHIKNVEIFKMKDGKKVLLTKNEIIKKKCKYEIELANIWIYGANYGLIWYVSKIQVME